MSSHLQSIRPRVHGKYVRAGNMVTLPSHRCAKCGSDAPGGSFRSDTLVWYHPYILLTLLLSGIITILLYFATRKKIRVDYYLCPKCQDSRKIWSVTTTVVAAIAFVGLALTLSSSTTVLPAMFAGAALISVIARAYWVRAPMQIKGVDGPEYLIGGVSEEARTELSRRNRQLPPGS